MVAVGHLARRLEPACLPGHDRLLPCGVSAIAQGPGAGRVAPRNRMSDSARHRLPGDRPSEEELARMLRVDHAGEYGATRIYEGQLDVLGRARAAGVIRQMAETEKRHLARVETLLQERRVRPTLLHPLWNVAGYALGAATALMGEHAAMACTVAVEEVIDEHYQAQAALLGEGDPALRDTIRSFRDDELAHRDLAIAHGAEESPAYDLISAAVKTGSRVAIRLATHL